MSIILCTRSHVRAACGPCVCGLGVPNANAAHILTGDGEMCQSELTRICWANVGKGVCEMNTLAVIIPFCGSRGLIGKLYGGLWCGARRTRNALINRS